MHTKQEKTSSDLEDGEIREEGIEDISDCSLSEIVTMKKDLESDEEVDIDVLREEALKSMLKGEEENNEEELEEELCRLEALKSLLKNIEATESVTSVKEIEKKRRPKRKRKQESKPTQKKPRETGVSDPSQPVDVEKRDRIAQNQKNETAPSRPWYPTAELALTCTCPPDESDLPSQKTGIEVKSDLVRQVMHVRTPDLRKVNYVKQNSPLKNRLVKNIVDKTSPIRLNSFTKVTKHSIRKFDSTSLMTAVKPFAHSNATKRGKYKLVNNVNCATNKFPSLKINRLRNHSTSKSLFSINRLKCPQVTVAPPRELIIHLDDKDSDSEEILESSGANTPIVCDIEAKRDKVPAATEQPNQTQSKAPTVMKNSSSNSVARDDRSETNSSSQVDVDCEPHVHSVRSSTPSSDATVVVGRKDESSVFEDDKTTCSSKSDEVLGELVTTNARDLSVLAETEGYLVKIREKLLSDLGELDKTMKRNTVEQEKLNALLKKLNFLKSMVAKFETKIKLQQSRLSANVACMTCLLNGVQTRTSTCSKLEEMCRTMGKNLHGPVYKPPTKLESVIADKRQGIDLSKCKPAPGSK